MEQKDAYTIDNQDQWQEIRYGDAGEGIPARQSEWNIRQCALVLDSRAVPCFLENREDGLHLLVPPAYR